MNKSTSIHTVHIVTVELQSELAGKATAEKERAKLDGKKYAVHFYHTDALAHLPSIPFKFTGWLAGSLYEAYVHATKCL